LAAGSGSKTNNSGSGKKVWIFTDPDPQHCPLQILPDTHKDADPEATLLETEP